MTDKIRYTQIDDNTCDYEHEHSQNAARRQRGWIPALASFFSGLITMAVAMSLYSVLEVPEQPRARTLPHARNGSDPITGVPLSWSHGDCGNSPEDARARDCQYSIVLHAWLPKSCLTEADADDSKEMYKDRDWVYETGSGRNLTMEELADGDYEHFTTSFEWHVTHCMYVWKRLHRVMLDPSQELDSYTASYHHTNHCVKMIGGDAEGMKDLGTKTFVKFPKCAK